MGKIPRLILGIPVKVWIPKGGRDIPKRMGLDGDNSIWTQKFTGQAGNISGTLAYSTVDDGSIAIQNVGTGNKTPLYTQMILNQKAIKLDADTVMAKVVVPVGTGKAIAQYSMTTANEKNLYGDGNDTMS